MSFIQSLELNIMSSDEIRQLSIISNTSTLSLPTPIPVPVPIQVPISIPTSTNGSVLDDLDDTGYHYVQDNFSIPNTLRRPIELRIGPCDLEYLGMLNHLPRLSGLNRLSRIRDLAHNFVKKSKPDDLEKYLYVYCESVTELELNTCIDIDKDKDIKQDQFMCSVCLNEIIFDKSDIHLISKISCKHIFHTKCIINWFKIKLCCPCCRTKSKQIAKT